uniref:Uncharacterized protein n=1 Tax=Romanomermis culicivorax TaxID=13658 RepID=A0A915IR38_ROMCU
MRTIDVYRNTEKVNPEQLFVYRPEHKCRLFKSVSFGVLIITIIITSGVASKTLNHVFRYLYDVESVLYTHRFD